MNHLRLFPPKGYATPEEIVQEINSRLKRKWEAIEAVAVNGIKETIKLFLSERLPRVLGYPAVLDKYPMLRNQQRFIEMYMQCVQVFTDKMQLTVQVSEEDLRHHGLPGNIAELLEYGSSEFPQCEHLNPAVKQWRQQNEQRILRELVNVRSNPS